ncbi:hypothetical protein [Dethiothermospora halolimnae]|uniref:hypothetical protein n=1 Tax=Dethiothermospora halolimnae TaxID=3114390 RepID=UPI003CCC34AA
MPTSYYGQISTIMDFILKEKPKSILDIGVGFGKYGVLCRDLLDIPYERYEKNKWKVTIDGIEGFESYNNPIHEYVYDNIYYGLIEEVMASIKKQYQLAIMIDVLEHFDKEDGKKVIEKILDKTKTLIISVPEIPAKQSYLDNFLEEHKSVWKIKDFKGFHIKKAEILPMGINNASIIVLIEGRGSR